MRCRVGMASGQVNLQKRLDLWRSKGYPYSRILHSGLTYSEAHRMEEAEARRLHCVWRRGGDRVPGQNYYVYQVSNEPLT